MNLSMQQSSHAPLNQSNKFINPSIHQNIHLFIHTPPIHRPNYLLYIVEFDISKKSLLYVFGRTKLHKKGSRNLYILLKKVCQY